jgi:glycosyltransferase involved in cell wall biosynthesis
MKICLIIEGSYPHVTGGVSTWVQLLIKDLTENQFIIYAIGAEEKYRGSFKYDLPENVLEVREVFLDEMLKKKGRYGKSYRLSNDTILNLKKLITGEIVDWEPVFKLMAEKNIKNEMDFFMSINFFDILRSAYEEKYSSVPFTEFFWTVRSMLVPLFFLLKNCPPEADLYHSAATGYSGIFGSMAKFMYKKPFVVTEHGIYSREREEEIIKSWWVKGYFKDMWIKFFYNVCGGVYSSADKVFTLFEKNKQIEIELGCKKRKIKIVPNGIELDSFNGNGNNSGSNGSINIGTITRVVPIKDIKTMLYSFYLVREAINNAKFFIMGPVNENEEYYSECKKLARRLDLMDMVEFTGRIDVKKYIGDMDIMVLTSISEGQPFAILEGMAAKKPFVTTDVGGCSELLYGRNDNLGRAGTVVPVMDVEKIAKAIIKLAEDPGLRKKMGEAGFKRVSSFYTSEKCVASYRKIYKGIEKTLKAGK